MVKVGLVGEDPNDTSSIINLLNQKFRKKVQFIALAKRVTGCNLDSKKLGKIVSKEFATKKCSFIIYVRDLDGFATQQQLIDEKFTWYQSIDAAINNKSIFLLNIWELEALVLADIQSFNKIYKITHKFTGNPSREQKPKELLKRLTDKCKKRFHESHCPEIFKKLNLATVAKNCSYFQEFVSQLDKRL